MLLTDTTLALPCYQLIYHAGPIMLPTDTVLAPSRYQLTCGTIAVAALATETNKKLIKNGIQLTRGTIAFAALCGVNLNACLIVRIIAVNFVNTVT